MIAYQTKVNKLSGSNYSEIKKRAMLVFNQIKKKTKRQAYIRSAYFQKDKIFFNYFWDHLFQKNPKERFRRLKYFEASLGVIKNSKNHPIIEQNPNDKSEIFYRFLAMTREGSFFYVQIKENKKSGKKYFMSCFPLK